MPDIGVVVIGRNEGHRLIDCLTSIAKQTNNVIYVDSGSTDGSIQAAERIGARTVKLDLTMPFTAARARNEGFAALMQARPTPRFVQFIDGDCELVAGWLDEARTFMTQCDNVAGVCGRRRERHPEISVYNRLCDIEWNTPIGLARECGGDSLIRVQAFEAVGGFSSELIAGEEPELCLRLRERGWKIWRLNAEMTRHDANMVRFRQWWLRAVRAGHAYAEVLWRHRRSQQSIYGKETARAVFWGCLVPLAIGIGVFVQPFALLGALVYPLQICSLALRRGANKRQSWTYALFTTVGKFAEFNGISKFCWRRCRGQATELIEYKKAA